MKKILDAICYINLARRKDRRESIEREILKLSPAPKAVHRIEAIDAPVNGHYGCCESHIKALKFAQKQGFATTLILEDDAIFCENTFTVPDIPFDVFMLGGNVLHATTHGNYLRVKKALCSHAYIISKHYIPTLLDCFEKATTHMQNHYFTMQSEPFAIDKAWHSLQNKDMWLCKSIIAQQGASYSDIYHTERNRIHKSPFAT